MWRALSNLLSELKRRSVLRVGTAYILTAWLIIQVANTLLPIFGFGELALRYLTISLIIGLLPVVILSWVFELTPEGFKVDKAAGSTEPPRRQSGKRLDRVIILVLAIGVAYFAFDKFVMTPAREAARAEQIAEQIEQARLAGRSEALIESSIENSIAVLPFVNVSADPEQEYFSDGISEELLNLLAQIPELRVISRSSAFSFKGQNISAVEVAEQLNVAHVLEGSVRRAGDRIRITAQLIDPGADTQLWSESYDREMGDIFAIQDEIAAMVVERLKLELLGGEPSSDPVDPDAYALFLQARHVARLGTPEALEESIELYRKALEIDPHYVAAWDSLAAVYSNQVAMGLRAREEGVEMAREATERALSIEPDYAQSHAELGWLAMSFENDLSNAASHYDHALSLEPENIYILSGAAVLLKNLGRIHQAIRFEEYIISHDPLNPGLHHNLAVSQFFVGHWDKAIASWRTALRLSPGRLGTHYFIGLALLYGGEDPAAALAEFEKEPHPPLSKAGLAMAFHALGRDDEYERQLNALINDWGEESATSVVRVYATTGQVDSAFEWLDRVVEAGMGGRISPADPGYDLLRDDPRWSDLLERIGKVPEQLEAIDFEVRLPTDCGAGNGCD